MKNTSCLSGQLPISLRSNSCRLGFLCLNTTAENPPEFCPPTESCQATRLQPANNICSEPQGLFEPTVCTQGYFCPRGGREKILCPRGHYCALGSYEPRKCGFLSVCNEGSTREISLIGFVCLAGIYLLFAMSAIIHKKCKLRQRRNKSLAASIGQFFRDIEAATKVRRVSEVPGNLKPASEQYITRQEHQYPNTDDLFRRLAEGKPRDNRGLVFQLHDINYTLSGVPRPILRGVSGEISKGRIFGILGSSGAGKSTLLGVLTGKTKLESGSFAINGVQANCGKYKRLLGFVPQDDVVFPELSVWDNIFHTAYIRLRGTRTNEEIKHQVEEVISYLGLSHVKGQPVGSVEDRGISGGERKRVCIGREIVAMPMAVILDEPTSGLDATTALSIMAILKRLSTLGMTVICSLHQPRVDIFELLDDILVLTSGQPAYFGAPSAIQQYFMSMGCNFPDTCNPADVVMDIITRRKGDSEPSWFDYWSGQLVKTSETWVQSSDRYTEEAVRIMNGLRKTSKEQVAAWYRQVLQYIRCGAKQQKGQIFGVILEMTTAAACGTLIGLSMYESKGHLFQGYFKQPFTLLSSAVDYSSVPISGLLSSLAISLAAAPAGIKTIAEESASSTTISHFHRTYTDQATLEIIFYQEVHYGHSASAYFIGKDLATYPRLLLSALHFTAFLKVLAASTIPVHILFVLNAAYFFSMYGLASLVASFVRRQDALLLAMLTSLIAGVLDGFGPRLAQVKLWKMEWLWYICPGTWYSEAWFNEHTAPFTYLYDVGMAARYTGYTTGRTSFDIGIIIVIGVVYRIIAYAGLVLPTMEISFRRVFQKLSMLLQCVVAMAGRN